MKSFLRTIFVLAFGLTSCRNSSRDWPVEKTHFLMDTLVRVSVYDRRMPKRRIEAVIDHALKVMEEIEARASIYVDTSDISRVVKSSGQNSVRVSSEIHGLLQQSVEVSEKTRGAFDVTVGVVKKLWGFETDRPRVPDGILLSSLLSRVDYRKIDLRDADVFLREPGMCIDLGGIAKGYIIDRGVAVLQEEGIRSGIIDAGGDLRAFGSHPEGRMWKFGIQHPRGKRGELIGVIETEGAGIATSGDYERYFIQEGKRYHHILDPKTGFPARGCVSVTMVAESALLADAYATAVFVMGPEEGMALIESIPSLEGMIVYEEEGELRHVTSDGFLEKIHFQ